MRIIILNAEAGGNKGAEAMLETLLNKIFERLANPVVVLEVSSNFEYYHQVFLKRFQGKNIELAKFTPKKIFNPYSTDVKQIDLAIDIGGINFHDGSYKATLRNFVRFLPFVLRRKKLVFFIQDIGPSSKLFTRMIGRIIMRNSEAVFTRSQKSYEMATTYFKIPRKKVKGPFPDATLLYKPANGTNGIVKSDKYIVFTPSAIMFNKYGEDYLQMFVDLHAYLSSTYEVIGLVHNFTKNQQSSDEQVLRKINDRLEKKMRIISDNVPSSQLKAFLGKANFVISSRYHVVVGALAMDVPAIAIGWNPKYSSFLSLYGKTDWNIDFDDNALNKIVAKIESHAFLTSRSEINGINQRLKGEVKKSFDMLFELIE